MSTTDLAASVKQARELGGKVLNGPMDVPRGQVAQCLDHQGTAFALHYIDV